MEKFKLRDRKIALFIIDIQEKLAPAIDSFDLMKKPLSVLLETAACFDLPIYITEQYPKGLGRTLPFIKEKLNQLESFLFEKKQFNALLPEILTSLQQKQIDTILISGMETHICVYQTVRDLLENGFNVLVAEDAVGSRTKRYKENGLAMLREMGALISNAETVAFDLLQSAEHPCFKRISGAVK